jgi:hypothetical protein
VLVFWLDCLLEHVLVKKLAFLWVFVLVLCLVYD